MKSLLLLFLFLALGRCSPAQDAGGQAAPAPGGDVAFVGVNVIPMDTERVLANQTVLVRDGRIVDMGPASGVAVPEGALRVEAGGKYLIPGLAEMHGHIPPPTDPAEFVESVLFMYVANGITTVRGMLGHPGQLDLKARTNSGRLIGPTLYLAGPSFNGQSTRTPEQAVEKVRQQHAEGWDLLKVHPGVPRAAYDAMARTAQEVGIRFGGHVPAEVGLLHALDMGQETFDHIDGYVEYAADAEGRIDEAKLAEAIRRTKEAGAWVVPTMVLWETLMGTAALETLRGLPELKYMPPDQVSGWTRAHEDRLQHPNFNRVAAERLIENRMRVLRALNESGARILMGTDAPQQFSVPGFSIYRELERMAEAGMTPYQILASGTKHVGEYFADEDSFGTIAPGQRADLLLLDANPLDDVAHVARRAGVMVQGRWLPEAEIQAELNRIAERYK